MITELTQGQTFTAATTGIDRDGVRTFSTRTYVASYDQAVEPFHTPETRTGIAQDRVMVDQKMASGSGQMVAVPALVVTGSIRLVDA